MISIIIPTLWKYSLTLSVLEELSKHKLVSEIILIDNSQLNFNVDIPKVKHIKEAENTFVNPAWNKGFQLAKEDRLMFLNDDVVFDTSLVNSVYDFINESIGMIGMGSNCFNSQHQFPFEIKKIHSRPNGYGCIFFIHKNSYSIIPDDLKIYFGDDWLFKESHKPNFEFTNFKVSGYMCLSSNSNEFSSIITSDWNCWEKYK